RTPRTKPLSPPPRPPTPPPPPGRLCAPPAPPLAARAAQEPGELRCLDLVQRLHRMRDLAEQARVELRPGKPLELRKRPAPVQPARARESRVVRRLAFQFRAVAQEHADPGRHLIGVACAQRLPLADPHAAPQPL